MYPPPPTAAQRAIEALRALHPTRTQVPALLSCYAHRAELTPADRALVLAAFAPTPRRRYLG